MFDSAVEAYIDIETTGLVPWASEITVIGFHICDGIETRSVQLVGSEITRVDVMNTLEGVDTIYTLLCNIIEVSQVNCQQKEIINGNAWWKSDMF